MKHTTLKLTAFNLIESSADLLRSLIGRVAAGAPLEVIGDEEEIDLNYIVRKGEKETIIVTLQGDSMGPEICDGDRVVVSLGRHPAPGNIVIAKIDGGYTIKRFTQREFKLFLVPSNDAHVTREMIPGDVVIGVVTYILKKAA